MKKTLAVMLFSIVLFACKDEFNLPEYTSIVDGDAPVFTITSPTKNATYTGSTSIPVNILIKDNFYLKNFRIRVQDEFGTQQLLNDQVNTQDSVYTYQNTINLTSSDSAVYEVYLEANDSVGNNANTTYLFTYK